MTRARAVLVAVAVAHVVLSVGHGVVHLAVPVDIHGWQYGLAGALVFVSCVGFGLLVRGRAVAGARLLLAAGLVALTFEALAHFVVVNPDHVSTVGAASGRFATTAAFSVAGDAALVAASFRVLSQSVADRGRRRERADGASPD